MEIESVQRRADAERIERLLEEIHSMAGPTTWQRVEELVHRLVTLYGDGLGQLVGHVRAEGALGPSLEARLCADELVSSLLVLHGLHPRSPLERIERALDALRPRLGNRRVVLKGVDEDGTARLRVEDDGIEELVRETVEAAAPDLAAVAIERPGDDGFVPLRVHGRPGR